jgi:transcriptional regulator with XRE-family HTH domain
MTLGQSIKYFRKDQKQKNIAQKLGISPTTYCRIESDKIRITTDKLAQIAEVLGVKVSEIYLICEK